MAPVSIARPNTSPSNLRQRQLCPKSAQLEAEIIEDETSRDARLGKLLHTYWAGPNFDRSFLSADERDVLDLADRLLQDVLNKLALETQHEFHVEQTLTSKDGRLTGTPDKVYVWGGRRVALVVDLKSGFAVVERAELNLQLRGYAILVVDNYAVDTVYVAILQPRLWSPSERITLARYEKDDFEQARTQIAAILDASEREDAPLKAGEEQCRFCKAKLTCDAFRQALARPLQNFKTEIDLSKRAREAFIEQRLKECSDIDLERVLEACKFATFVSRTAHDEARTRIRAGHFTNFVLGKEWEKRTVTNVRRAIAMLALSGVASREDILDLCDFSLGDIEERYRDKNKTTWQQARDKVNKILASVIEREPCEPRILPK
jgi:hypothetical protein